MSPQKTERESYTSLRLSVRTMTRVAKQAGIAPMLLTDKEGNRQPMVDKRGRFFVLDEIDADFLQKCKYRALRRICRTLREKCLRSEFTDDDTTLDVDISVRLKKENKAFKVEKQEHNYPHCWRTDKPVLYYPLDSWFIKTTGGKRPDAGAKPHNQLETGQHRRRTVREMAGKSGGLEFIPFALLGHSLPIWVSEDGTEKK